MKSMDCIRSQVISFNEGRPLKTLRFNPNLLLKCECFWDPMSRLERVFFDIPHLSLLFDVGDLHPYD